MLPLRSVTQDSTVQVEMMSPTQCPPPAQLDCTALWEPASLSHVSQDFLLTSAKQLSVWSVQLGSTASQRRSSRVSWNPLLFTSTPYSSFEEIISGNSSSGHRLCARGFYCESGTGRNWTACPAGTYSNELGLTDISECLDCPGEIAHKMYSTPIG